MNKKFKDFVIFSDFDGTLLNNKKEVSTENKNAINYFIENGGQFSVASGRGMNSCRKYVEDFKMEIPSICYNGAVIYDYNNNEILREHELTNAKKELVRNIERDYDYVGIEIYSDDNVYIYRDTGMARRSATRLLEMIFDMPENLFELKWTKVLLVLEKEKADLFEEDFYKRYNLKLCEVVIVS